MELLILPSGVVRCLYDEALPLRRLGQLSISRGSHVEPTVNGTWMADLSPVDGPVLGPFDSRSAALKAEHCWLTKHWLARRPYQSDRRSVVRPLSKRAQDSHSDRNLPT